MLPRMAASGNSVARVGARAASALAIVIVGLGGSGRAHHSRSDIDETTRVTLTGTLTRVDWRNPHIEFSVESKSESGQPLSWSIESGAPSALALRKITKAMFASAVGKTVTVEISTARDGSRYGTSWKITFPDGSTHVMRQ